jgi:hypothetical protein
MAVAADAASVGGRPLARRARPSATAWRSSPASGCCAFAAARCAPSTAAASDVMVACEASCSLHRAHMLRKARAAEWLACSIGTTHIGMNQPMTAGELDLGVIAACHCRSVSAHACR